MPWVSVISVVVAAVALLVGFSNRNTARRALALSERQEERHAARLDLSFTEAISWRPAGMTYRWIGVHVLAVNPTDGAGSLVASELHIAYTIPGGTTIVLKLPHDSQGGALPEGVKSLEIPCPLPSNGAVSGWLVFKVDDALIGNGAIQRYDVVLRDSRGPEARVEPWNLREIMNGEAS